MNATSNKANALVMAASRRGATDSVAQLQNKTHKCFVEIDGVVMLERVVRALIDSGMIATVYISIEPDAPTRAVPALAALMDQGRVKCVASRGNLADSVLAAGQTIDDLFPLVITTGDNALHTSEMVADFTRRFLSARGDVAVAFTSAAVVDPVHPDSGLNYHRLKDGAYSACNLYGLRTAAALRAVGVFASGGQFGKKHLRILKSFGLLPFILYKLQAATLDALMARIGRNLGLVVDTILLPYPEGPIDVDNPHSFALSERVLRERRERGE